MHNNVLIQGVGTFHPATEVDNAYFIEHFRHHGIEVEGLLRALGKEKRRLDRDGKETIITMATKAAKEALKSCNTEAKDIDMIIFATDSPEYLCPSNALILHDILGTVNAHMTFDMNTNCTGMLTAFDVASRLLKSDPSKKKALIIGGLHVSMLASHMDPVIYGNFADAAAAVVLEVVEEEQERGFLDAIMQTETSCTMNFAMPKHGFSKIYDESIPLNDRKFQLDPFDTSFVPKVWARTTKELLEQYDYGIEDLNHILFSQFSLSLINDTLTLLNLDTSIHTYVGNQYGYTGVTSPFISFYEALKLGNISTGDLLIFCSVGAGYNTSTILYRM